ncbi:MAG: hypothetical protein ACI857_002158 [Arenicella sp.]|jgi:hypothetical protein
MIIGGVGYILKAVGFSELIDQYEVQYFLYLIIGASALKLLYGFVAPDVKDPIFSQQLAQKLFFIGIALIAVALLMKNYHIDHYQYLLYVDILFQVGALAVSFLAKDPLQKGGSEDILDE